MVRFPLQEFLQGNFGGNSVTRSLISVGFFSAVAFLISAAVWMSVSSQTTPEVSDPWLMRSHDMRRTGKTSAIGPRRGDDIWQYVANDGYVINIEPAATTHGVYFGTWGLFRNGGRSKTQWDKCDGRLYGLNVANGSELWKPIHPGFTPFAYKYDGRKPGLQDRQAGLGLHLNYFNGTVEGTPAIDETRRMLYFGRGDGCVYGVDYAQGKVLWKYLTQDPSRGDDPESGGEVVGGPLLTPDGRLLFATFAAPATPRPPKEVCHETNAIYCIDTNGKFLWRYPSTGGFANVFNAPLAVSPDLTRVYAVTALVNPSKDCEVVALERSSGKLIWKLPLIGCGGQDLAVGNNGVIYVAGMIKKGFKIEAAAFAISDNGDSAKMLWGPNIASPQLSQFAGGIALIENGSRVEKVVISTTNLRTLFESRVSGKLFLIDPATGRVEAAWSAATAVPPCMGGLTDLSIDGEGKIFVGAHGTNAPARSSLGRGRMYCIKYDGANFEVAWSHQVNGNIDWASPSIGPDGGLFFGSSARLNPLASIFAHPLGSDISNADPVFYGVHDNVK